MLHLHDEERVEDLGAIEDRLDQLCLLRLGSCTLEAPAAAHAYITENINQHNFAGRSFEQGDKRLRVANLLV
jgi:hypothetical protein